MLAIYTRANYNKNMDIQKIGALPEGVAFPARGAFGEARSVQSGTIRTCSNALLIESGGRFKRFSDGTEYIRIEEGSGYFKWKRGELPFAAGDVFEAERPGEYDFYGAGVFLVVKQD